ncbi:MAG TPA: restriction endonuclease subunit S [Candidatus Paceibacterota bacterium]|nr:restriction endonuclease subunit S [Candidatus Paceibacterota bacterium]
MATKITTIYASEIELTARLEPRFFYNQSLLKKFFDDYGFEELNDFASLKSGSTPEHFEERKNKDDLYFIKSADVKRYNLNFSTISFVSRDIHYSRKKFKVIPNDVLLSNTGKYLGLACLIPKTIAEATTNQNIVRIRFREKACTRFNPFFILSFLNSLFGQIEIESLLTLTGQKYLNMEKFREFKIPKINEKGIKKISKKTKAIIENEIKSLSILEQTQGLFYQKLGLDFSKIEKQKFYSVKLSDFREADLWTPIYSYPFYVNILKTIQEKWETVPLGEIATAKKGDEVGSDNYNKYLDKKDSDVPFIRTSDIVNYEVDQLPDFYIPEEIYQELKQDVKTGDVLFNNDGKIGLVAMLTPQDKVILQSHIKRLRLKKEAIEKYHITQEYLFLVLTIKEIARCQAERYTVIQSTIPTISNRILDFEIPILDKVSIDEITKLVKEAFELKDEKKKLIREVREEIDSYFGI